MAWTRQATRSVTSIFLSFRSFSSSECATKSITPIYISSPTLITPPFNLKGLQEPPSNIIYPLGWPSIDFFRDEVVSPGIEDSSAPMQCRWKSIPTNRVRKNRHGFLARIKTKGGRKILKRRLLKGRYRLTW